MFSLVMISRRMATSVAVLQRLQARAAQAEQLITQLRAQLFALKKEAAVSACKAEANQLAAENAKLRQEVQNVKEKLIAAEIKNGLTQVSLPRRSEATSTAVLHSATEMPPSEKPAQRNATITSSDEQQQQQQPQQKKKQKAEKKEGKKPQQPGPAAAPVDVSRLNLRIGHIVSAKKHPDADGLYVEEVDLGEGRCRTIVSGLVKHVPLEKMQDRLAIFLINLKPAKMRGIMSEGMIMCASSPDLVEIIDPPPGAAVGDQVTVDGYDGSPDPMLNPKKKIWEQIQPELQVNADGIATYKGASWKIEGKGVCKAPTARNQGIK